MSLIHGFDDRPAAEVDDLDDAADVIAFGFVLAIVGYLLGLALN